MTIDPYILAFSAITVAVTIWMGFRSAKTSKTASDFFVAGRSVSVGWNASAISGEYLSAASFMGVAGMVMSSGYDALWYPVCYACGYLFLLLFIAGPLRRFGAYTIPDFAEGRFDSPVFRKIAVVFVLFIGFFYTMPQMKGAGTTLAYIFPGLPYWVGVLLVGAVITLNVALGGMKGITLVQAFQYWIKLFAISVPIFVLMAVYGHYGKQLSSNAVQPTSVTPNENRKPPTTQEMVFIGYASGYMFADASSFSMRQFASTKETMSQLKDAARDVQEFLSPPRKVYETKEYRGMDLCGILLQSEFPAKQGSPIVPIKVVLWSGLQNRMVFWGSPKSATARETVQSIERALETMGVSTIRANDGTMSFLPTDYARSLVVSGTEIGDARKALPAKAPADATWLNPFGPLTTKAAKAAAAALTNRPTPPKAALPGPKTASFDVNASESGQPPLVTYEKGRVTYDKVQRVRDRLHVSNDGLQRLSERGHVTFGFGAVPSDSAAVTYAAAAVTSDAAAVPSDKLPVSSGSTAVPTDPAAMQKAWLDKHEKPLALLYTYSLIIALVCGTAGLPHILVRFYTNPDGVAAKRTTMWVMILIGVFYVFPPVFGVMGRNLLPELYNGIGSKGTDKIVLELPRIINERYGVLGSILSGITCAGAFAAFMSTFSGLLVSMTGALAHDVYGRMLNPKATAEQRMKMFKWCAVIVGGVAVALGSQVEKLEINFMVGQAFAIAAASYFPLLFMSVWWRKLTMKGAATGMLTGGLLALGGISLTSFTTLGILKWDAFWAAHPLLRILCEQPAIWAVPLAITLMVVVSKLTRQDIPADIRMKMLVLHAPEKLGLKQEYIQEHQAGH